MIRRKRHRVDKSKEQNFINILAEVEKSSKVSIKYMTNGMRGLGREQSVTWQGVCLYIIDNIFGTKMYV